MTAALLCACSAFALHAGEYANEHFSFTTPDDSWIITTDNLNRHSVTERVSVHRSDAKRHVIELARIDFMEAPFAPQAYLEELVIGRKDVFCRAGRDFSAVGDTTFCGYTAKRVTFTKTSNDYTYLCEALAFNTGFNTYLIIIAHRDNVANVVGWILGQMKFLGDNVPLNTSVDYVAAAQRVLAKHNIAINDNEFIDNIRFSKDSATVEIEIEIPYLPKDAVNVPAFVQVMRDRWVKSFPKTYSFNLLIRAIADAGKSFRYTYTDTKMGEIGSLVITPPEYQMILKNAATQTD